MHLAALRLDANLLAMVAPHIDLAADNLIRRPIMDAGKPGKLLAAFGALQVSMSVVFKNHVDIALHELPSPFFFVDVQKLFAFLAVNLDGVGVCHDPS